MMTILKTVSFFMFFLGGLKIESCRFEDENEYKYEILLKVFARVLKKKKKKPRKASFYFFSLQ